MTDRITGPDGITRERFTISFVHDGRPQEWSQFHPHFEAAIRHAYKCIREEYPGGGVCGLTVTRSATGESYPKRD